MNTKAIHSVRSTLPMDQKKDVMRTGRYLGNGVFIGAIGGLVSTLVMDLVLMGALVAAELDALTTFSMVGDTVARFVSLLGLDMAGGVPFGVATIHVVGPIIGAVFGAVVTRVDALHVDTRKKSIVLAVLYIEVASQPLLVMTPILLGTSTTTTLLWFGGSFIMHLIWGTVLGLVVSKGLVETDNREHSAPIERKNNVWWKGTHGEWYVVAQLILMVLVFAGPRTGFGLPTWIFPYTLLGSIGGAILLVAGTVLLIAGIFKLGANLTPVPYPKENATLVETGPYQVVRHPMYSGGILIAFGWAFWVHGWLTLVYAILLFVFFDVKSRREEQWLKEKFSGYGAYQKRVHKLIPFIY